MTVAARTGRVYFVTVNAQNTPILPADPYRCTVAFFGPNATRVTISCDPIAAVDQGPTLLITGSWVKFCREEWGDLPSRAWYAWAGGAGALLGVAEAFATEPVR